MINQTLLIPNYMSISLNIKTTADTTKMILLQEKYQGIMMKKCDLQIDLHFAWCTLESY